MNLNVIKPDTLIKRDEALNENFAAINRKVEDTARVAEAGFEAAFDAQQKASSVTINLSAHVADKNNPHEVTAAQLGLANAYVYRGSIANYTDLPASPATGDVYNIVNADEEHSICAGDNVAWNGTAWDNLSGVFDTSALEAMISTVNSSVAALQTTVSNLETQVGTGVGIDDTTVASTSTYSSQKIESLAGSTVLYTPQSLTDEQKTQVKFNIGITDIDVSNLIPKTGDRGLLNGYQQRGELDLISNIVEGVPSDAYLLETSTNKLTVYAERLPDVCLLKSNGELNFAVPTGDAAEGKAWIKLVQVASASGVFSFQNPEDWSSWVWTEEAPPVIMGGDWLVLFWDGAMGYIHKLPVGAAA